jgi:RNA polymerase sigma-70 factor, ECF subfamily
MIQENTHPLISTSDEEARLELAQVDPGDFGELYAYYAPRIYKYLLSRLGNIEEARDVTSQTFLNAFELFPRYQHRGYFSAWLFSIARSKYVDHLRKTKRSPETLEDTWPDPLPDPLSQVIETERLTRLRGSIRRLAEEEQEMLRLRYVAEISFAEMAAILHKKEDAVKKALYRLLARLQSQMEER